MIGQYLSNTNEIATVLILSKILELNKAVEMFWDELNKVQVGVLGLV